MQKVLVFDTFHNSKEDYRITKDILREYDRLYDAQVNESLQSYLETNHGRKMAGAEFIWKYRLNSSARILYTFGKHVPYIRDAESDAIVLLDYELEHDAQGRTAKHINLNIHHDYEEIGILYQRLHNILNDTEAASLEDIEAAVEMLRPEFESNATIRIFDPEQHSNIEDIVELEAYLTNEQAECYKTFVNNPCPTIIMGGAGSGKTLVAEYVLSACKEDDIIYFTQSEALRRKAEEQYKSFSGNKKNVEFYNINTFAIEQLGWDESKFVEYPQFQAYILSRPDLIEKLKKKNISIQDLWTEIRGTIKGSLSSEWTRTTPIFQQDFSKSPELIQKKYLSRTEKKENLILSQPTYLTKKAMAVDSSLSKEAREQLSEIVTYFESVDKNQKTISWFEYKKLKEDSSTLEEENREFVFGVCNEYNKYLEDNDLFDDNDLARNLIADLNKFNILYDLVVVDEVQDYTEMQIDLAYRICNGQGILFAGDEHQIINPTMFRESRIRDLFYDVNTGKSPLVSKRLVRNFRCPQGPVEFSNSISKLRKEKIASLNAASEQEEFSERKGFKPLRLNPEMTKQMLETLIRFPKTVVLVATEEDRDELIKIYGSEEYRIENNPIIFTIPEIKGMEYKYVLCYNLFGSHKDRWEEIMSSVNPSGKTKNRYYFNLIYVAVTRTLETVALIDSFWHKDIENKLPFVDEAEFNIDRLRLDRLTNTDEDWIEAGQEYEANGKYDLAINCYQKGNAPDSLIYRCYVDLHKGNRQYDLATKYYLLNVCFDERVLLSGIESIYVHVDQDNSIYKIIQFFLRKRKLLNPDELIEWIRDAYSGFQTKEYDAICEYAISSLDNSFLERRA